MDYFKYTFNEDEWNIFLIEDNDQVLTKEGTAAEVHFSDKEIYFRKSEVTLKIVLHELWHVYFGYCYISDTNNIITEDLEEISAALFSDKGSRILERGIEIYNKLLELKDKDENTK